MGEEVKKYKVTIISRDELVVYPKIGQPLPIVRVTYVVEGLPPSFVDIPKEKYSKETEAEEIRKDIEERLKPGIEELEV